MRFWNHIFTLNERRNMPFVSKTLIRRFHEAVESGAETVTIWGTGRPMREFLHVDDMADASLFVMALDRATYEANTEPMLSHINVGTGVDISCDVDLSPCDGGCAGCDPDQPETRCAGRNAAQADGCEPSHANGLAGAYRIAGRAANHL